jgi:hypothetical protein
MKLVMMALAQSGAVDSASNRISLFHIIEQMQSRAFPAPMPSMLLTMLFEKEAGDANTALLHTQAALDGSPLMDTQLNLSFQGRPRTRVMAGINGLSLPKPGLLVFSVLSEAKQVLGSWEVSVEQANGTATASPEQA